MKLWNVAGKSVQATLEGKAAELRSLAWAPDGKRLAVGTRYGTIQVWDIATREKKQTLTGLAGDVWSIAFSPDGSRLAGVDGDWNRPGLVRLWAANTWKEEAALKHTGEVLCVGFAKSGKKLAAGSWDKSTKIWELKSLRQEPR